jgi:hypothetical protein
MMSLKYGILSFLVSCAILLLILKNYEIWTQPIEWVPKKSLGKKSEIKPETKPEIKTEVPSTAGAQKDPSSIKSYVAIAGKNIFSPERKDFPIPMTAEGKKPLVRPQVVLYGVTITGSYQAASVTNPGRPLRKGERETMTLKIGDKVGEYTLAKIFSDRISLEAPGDTFEVLLYDARVPKKRIEVKTETKPAAVTSTLPAAPASPATTQPAPPAAASTARPTPPAVATPPPVPTPQIPRPTLPTRRGRMMYYPGSRTPTTPGTPATPATPAPVQGTEED